MSLDVLSTVRKHGAVFKTPPAHVPTQVVDVLNPWPGENVCLVQRGTPASALGGEILPIELAAGECAALVPKGGALPENWGE